MTTQNTLVPVEAIAETIRQIRGCKVILDANLARLYGVTTKQLNQAVKRNCDRFPEDFMFQVTAVEYDEALRSQIVTLKPGRGQHRKYLPYAFTEYGTVMVASVLNSPKAVEVSVYVTRAFVQQRQLLLNHAELSQQLARLERKLIASVNLLREHDDSLTVHESQIEALIEAINDIRTPPAAPRRPLGFRASDDGESDSA